MKVVLINIPFQKNKITRDMAGGLGFDATDQTLLPPLDLLYYASVLRNKGHKVYLFDSEAEAIDSERLIERIIKINPDHIIGEVSLPTIDNDTDFLKRLKQQGSFCVIAKTSIPFKPILKEILKRSQADFCLIPEVELIIDKILLGKTNKGTARIINGRLVIFPLIPIDNLDKLPYPARDLLNNRVYRYPLLGNNCTIMQTSRGCPFPCAYYCPYPLVQGNKWRAMGVGRVYNEIVNIVEKHKIKRILFRDATFTLDKNRIINICKLIIEKKLKVEWWCETRINCLDQELLTIMRKAGCEGINIGVETGDDQVMQSQGKPGVNLDKLKQIKLITDKINIKLHFLILIGLPEESKKSLLQTFRLIKKLKPYSLGVTTVTPYPGTQLFKDALHNKWIETQDWNRYSGSLAAMHTEKLSSGDIRLAQKMIIGEILLLQKGLLGQIGLIIEEFIFRLWILL